MLFYIFNEPDTTDITKLESRHKIFIRHLICANHVYKKGKQYKCLLVRIKGIKQKDERMEKVRKTEEKNSRKGKLKVK